MELIKRIDEHFNYTNKEIRVVGSSDEPWFVVKDICQILGLKNTTDAIGNIPKKWRSSETLKCVNGQSMNMLTISEAGFYQLIMRSRKKVAEKFQDIICEEILPSIRINGQYKMQSIFDEKKSERSEDSGLDSQELKDNGFDREIKDNEKICRKCNKIKNKDEFPEKRLQCKKCRNATRRQYGKKFDDIVEKEVEILKNLTKEKRVSKVDIYVKDELQKIMQFLKIGRKFNDTKQMMASKIIEYYEK
jgi:prophage antirepressor-like protein